MQPILFLFYSGKNEVFAQGLTNELLMLGANRIPAFSACDSTNTEEFEMCYSQAMEFANIVRDIHRSFGNAK